MVALSSCTDEIIMENSVEERPDPAKVHSGMERMVFNDRDDIKTLISQFNQDNRKRKKSWLLPNSSLITNKRLCLCMKQTMRSL